MHVAARILALSLSLGTFAAPVMAVEPDAPAQLITAEEAVLIAIRSRLTKVRLPRRPTQFQKGDALDRKNLAKFYEALGGRPDARPLWVSETGLTEQALAAINEIGKADDWGLPAREFDVPSVDGTGQRLSARELVALEMEMSLAILKYARYARGGRMDPKDLSLDIDRAPPLLAADVVLNGVHKAADVAKFLQGLHPKHEQFARLREAYVKARDEEAGLIEEGNDQPTKKSGRTKLSKRLLYNMEMWRWMPSTLGDFYVQPNIPEFRIRVIRRGRVIHSERIVAGKVANKTPIFSDELETIVFRPNWGIPNSIKVKEILPKIMAGKSIERQGFRVQYGGRDIDPQSVDWFSSDIRNYHVYQPPGKRNALGLVKFLFPNKHAVYFHDTPSKKLFNKRVRAYSHGCMRVRNPMKMAQVLFNQDRGWGQSKIRELASAGIDDNRISLNKKIPVHVTYFTASVGEDGDVKLVKDIYGHEKRIQKGFDGRAHTIVKEDRSLDKYLSGVVVNERRPRRRRWADDRPRRKKDRRWMRQVWGN